MTTIMERVPAQGELMQEDPFTDTPREVGCWTPASERSLAGWSFAVCTLLLIVMASREWTGSLLVEDLTGRHFPAASGVLGQNGLVRESPVVTNSPSEALTGTGVLAEVPPENRINLNSADADDLDSLPGLGPVLIGRIMAERERRPFESLEDVRDRVHGVGPKIIDRIRPYVQCSPPIPEP